MFPITFITFSWLSWFSLWLDVIAKGRPWLWKTFRLICTRQAFGVTILNQLKTQCEGSIMYKSNWDNQTYIVGTRKIQDTFFWCLLFIIHHLELCNWLSRWIVKFIGLFRATVVEINIIDSRVLYHQSISILALVRNKSYGRKMNSKYKKWDKKWY